MGFYVYCLLPSTGPEPRELRGIDGAPVRALDEGEVRIWLSDHESAPAPSLERVREHHAVVAGAVEEGVTPLPMRFGQWFPSDERLRERLREHLRDRSGSTGEGYQERLRAVQGALEFGVRIHDPHDPEVGCDAEPEEGPAASGRAHLEALARRAARRREVDARALGLGEELRERLGSLVREDRVRPLPPEEKGLASVAHLVAHGDVSEYRKRIEAFERARGDLVVYTSGPWPPYSFVEADG